jgi:hypothetical protein
MHFVIGRNENDIGALFNFRKLRGMVRANTARIEDGTPLESMPEGSSGLAPGMVLAHAKWSRLYFVCERENWTEDDYFNYADRRFRALGISKP